MCTKNLETFTGAPTENGKTVPKIRMKVSILRLDVAEDDILADII